MNRYRDDPTDKVRYRHSVKYSSGSNSNQRRKSITKESSRDLNHILINARQQTNNKNATANCSVRNSLLNRDFNDSKQFIKLQEEVQLDGSE